MDWKFWAKVWRALQKLIAFFLFMGIHYLTEITFHKLILVAVPEMPFWSDFYRIVTFAAFGLVYLHILWEMVAVFIPQLGGSWFETEDE